MSAGAYKTFDEVFAAMLTAYQSAGSVSGITVGDEFYQRAAALASCAWGLYQENSWTKDQAFPDTADEANLLHWGRIYELTKNSGESYAEFLARLLRRMRNKVSGGNLTDYEQWAMACSYQGEVPSSVACYGGTDAYGPGTLVEVVSVASGTPSAALLAAIKADALARGPVAPAQVYVVAASETSINISLTMTGGDVSLTKSYISAFVSSLAIGQAFYPEACVAFGYQTGATQVTVSSPTGLVTPDRFGRVVAAAITVTAA